MPGFLAACCRNRSNYGPLYFDDFERADGSLSSSWVGSTWTISSGKAINTPRLGEELNINPGFDSDTGWSKGAGWTISDNTAQHTGAGTLLANVGGGAIIDGTWYRVSYDVTFSSVGALGVLANIGSNDGVAISSNGSYVNTIRGASTGKCLFYSDSSLTLDNASAKAITITDLVAKLNMNFSDLKTVQAGWNIIRGTHGGVVGWWDGVTELQNCIMALHNGVNATLAKYVGSIRTQLISIATPYVAGAVIEIRRIPGTNTFQLWYNSSQVGTDQTVNDAAIINNGYTGLFSTYSGNQCTSILVDR